MSEIRKHSTDERIKALGLTEIRDAHEDYMRCLEMYREASDVYNSLPPLHPLASEAAKQVLDARKTLSNASVFHEELVNARLLSRLIKQSTASTEGGKS